jgi:hypothetical protein
MKTLLILAVLAAGVWYALGRVKENAAVKQMEDAPLKYTTSLQNDTARAKAAVDAANKGILQENQEVSKTGEAR